MRTMVRENGFKMGRLVMTRGVNDRCADDAAFCSFVLKSLRRFAWKDWGEMSDEDKRENDRSVTSGDRLFAAYENGTDKIWIITEWDRSVTTVLFPEEY